jgi:mannose-binding lectin
MNWSQPLSLSFIPTGKLVTFTALHQAALTQYVQIIDPSGKPIAFTTLTGQAAQFPIQGQGTQVGFFTNGAGSFTMQQGLQVQFANSGSQTSLVSYANPTQFFINGQIFGGGTLIVTEDQGGTDYNDTSFVIEWYQFQG